MSEREPRKRIPIKRFLLSPIEDKMAYSKNRCSDNARQINSIKPNLIFEVWFDKHYLIRRQFGDDKGIREGIDAAKVESLVTRSIEHLVAYSSILKNFTFINYELNGERANRIVLQESTEDGMLNVVIEVHLINSTTYEITVKTAMREDSFKISDSQFALEIIDNESILKRMEKGHIKEICHL